MRDESFRRIWVLASGLPPEANAWREDAWPAPTEFLALLIERVDAWGETMVRLALRDPAKGGRFPHPGQLEIRRPGDPKPKKKRGIDAQAIRAFFGRWGQRG